jgi:hypothetical protein
MGRIVELSRARFARYRWYNEAGEPVE